MKNIYSTDVSIVTSDCTLLAKPCRKAYLYRAIEVSSAKRESDLWYVWMALLQMRNKFHHSLSLNVQSFVEDAPELAEDLASKALDYACYIAPAVNLEWSISHDSYIYVSITSSRERVETKLPDSYTDDIQEDAIFSDCEAYREVWFARDSGAWRKPRLTAVNCKQPK